jgi:8-oxo-dGTP pyrophosphatase MutT (NUDIX family)
MNIDPNIPYFEDKDTPVRNDKPTVERKTINAIVYNPKKDEILCLDWTEHNWKTTIIGGIEDNEELEVAGRREIKEETGYTDLEYKGEVTKFYTSFYAAHKEVNRLADTTAVLFILNSERQEKVSSEETKNHICKWISKNEVTSFLNIEPQIFAVKEALKIIK